MKLFNSNPKTVTHNHNGQVYAIPSSTLVEVPDEAAKAILSLYPDCRANGNEDVTKPAPIWELSCGPAFEAARKEHNIVIDKVKNTVGPDRTEPSEPEAPADAVNADGSVNEKQANVHGCTYCGKDFPTLRGRNLHMRKTHNV